MSPRQSSHWQVGHGLLSNGPVLLVSWSVCGWPGRNGVDVTAHWDRRLLARLRIQGNSQVFMFILPEAEPCPWFSISAQDNRVLGKFSFALSQCICSILKTAHMQINYSGCSCVGLWKTGGVLMRSTLPLSLEKSCETWKAVIKLLMYNSFIT